MDARIDDEINEKDTVVEGSYKIVEDNITVDTLAQQYNMKRSTLNIIIVGLEKGELLSTANRETKSWRKYEPEDLKIIEHAVRIFKTESISAQGVVNKMISIYKGTDDKPRTIRDVYIQQEIEHNELKNELKEEYKERSDLIIKEQRKFLENLLLKMEEQSIQSQELIEKIMRENEKQLQKSNELINEISQLKEQVETLTKQNEENAQKKKHWWQK